MGKCDVCGKETEVFAACSACGAISFSYCQECMSAGIEPYDALVGMALYVDEFNESFKEQILLPSLKFHGKTMEEFELDVQKMLDGYCDWLQLQDECVEYECESDWFEGGD